MKKGFVAGIMVLVAVVAFSGRAFAWGVDLSGITQDFQDQVNAVAEALKASQADGFQAISVVGPFEIGPVIKKSTLFSNTVADYSAAVHEDQDVVLYGKLAAGVEESDLSTFGTVGKDNLLNATLKDNFDKVKEKSMLMWYSWKQSPSNILISIPVINSTCEVLEDKVHFRCSGFFTGQPFDGSYSVRAALLSGAPSFEMDVMEMLNTVADADEDGVPDAIDGCATADSFADPLAECVAEEDPDLDDDGVANVDDPCPSDPMDECVQPVDEDQDDDGVADVDDPCPSDPEDACVDPNAGAGNVVPVDRADDGGSCSLNPAAGGNPIAFLVIAFGLLPLAWRRKV